MTKVALGLSDWLISILRHEKKGKMVEDEEIFEALLEALVT